MNGEHHHTSTGDQVGQDHSSGHHGVDHTGHEVMFRRRFWICLILSVPVLLYSESIQDWFGFTMPEFAGSTWIAPAFAVLVFAVGGVPFLRMAWPEIQGRRPGMMTLISLAISVALVFSVLSLFIAGTQGFFWELVTLIDVMLLGHWLEMRSVRQASGALKELAKLLPDEAERIVDGGTETVPVSEIREGDLVLVRPGSSVPADGTVEEGESAVDESMMSGESRPVEKTPGSTVVAGTVNGDGSLRIRIEAVGEGTALAGIMRLVDEAQKSRSPTQALADRAAGWLFYIALASAAVTAVAWLAIDGPSVEVVSRVATVLVIACPHALGLAIPLVVALTTSIGAKNGILIRNRLAMETMRHVDTVMFDKTGTLTHGRFAVVEVVAAEGLEDDEVLGLAAGLEADSEHPIAKGIRRSADESGVSPRSVKDFEAIKGKGVRGVVDGETVHAGGPALLALLGLSLDGPMADLGRRRGEEGATVVYVVRKESMIGAIAVADTLRDESRQAVDGLHGLGIDVAVLTGDSEAVAASVAEELRIEEYFAEVLPEDKDKKVADLQKGGKRVAMVGDGVNDAPALTRADVGVAIGGGTDVAIESADIILVKDDPRDVVRAVELARASYRKMRQNLWWAAGYNIVAIPLAAGALAPVGILLSPAAGAALMSVSTIVVALNAQLLRRF